MNKIDLRPFERITINRNEVLCCAMILEEHITDKGKQLFFTDEKSRCLGEIKIAFERAFGATYSSEIDDCWFRRTETDCGAVIFNKSRALFRAERTIKQARFKEKTTSEKFYVFMKYDFGMWSL